MFYEKIMLITQIVFCSFGNKLYFYAFKMYKKKQCQTMYYKSCKMGEKFAGTAVFSIFSHELSYTRPISSNKKIIIQDFMQKNVNHISEPENN